jgi:hypothetical protein
MNFRTKNLSHSTFYVGYKEKYIKEMAKTKSLDLQIDSHTN